VGFAGGEAVVQVAQEGRASGSMRKPPAQDPGGLPGTAQVAAAPLIYTIKKAEPDKTVRDFGE
jgi:hypothetical protein